METTRDQLLSLATQIVSAHLEHNSTRSEVIPGLIREVYQTLAGMEPAKSAPRAPSLPHAGDGLQEQLICRECGMSMKMLKRHLLTVHRLTPAEYREKWGLPADHPMVTSNYAALRSALAKQSGLGKRSEMNGRWDLRWRQSA